MGPRSLVRRDPNGQPYVATCVLFDRSQGWPALRREATSDGAIIIAIGLGVGLQFAPPSSDYIATWIEIPGAALADDTAWSLALGVNEASTGSKPSSSPRSGNVPVPARAIRISPNHEPLSWAIGESAASLFANESFTESVEPVASGTPISGGRQRAPAIYVNIDASDARSLPMLFLNHFQGDIAVSITSELNHVVAYAPGDPRLCQNGLNLRSKSH
jgi:hypothetical protein